MLLFKNKLLFVGIRMVSRSEYDSYHITLASTDGGACEMRCDKSVYDVMSQADKMKEYVFIAEYNPTFRNQMKIVSVA